MVFFAGIFMFPIEFWLIPLIPAIELLWANAPPAYEVAKTAMRTIFKLVISRSSAAFEKFSREAVTRQTS